VHESSGLRFDVYERVHLPQEAAAIREIEEIELTPCVQAERRGEQVVLRGSLLLGGVYLPDDESRDSRQLEHWIPVEITLPLERVDRIEELAVEVDNFDYDLLDGRTLNITGVLTLRGIRAESAGSRQQTYAWGEEPYTVVHRRDLIGEAASEAADESVRTDGGDGPDAAADQSGLPGLSGEAGLSVTPDDSAGSEPEPAEWRLAGEREAEEADGPVRAAPETIAVPSANTAPSGDDAAEPGEGAAQSSGALDWKAFGAQIRENPPVGAEADEPGAAQAEEPEFAADAVQGAARDLSAAEPVEAAGSGTVSAHAEEPSAADVRSEAQSQAAQATDGGAQAASGAGDLRVAVGVKREDASSGADGSPGLGKLFFRDRREAQTEAEAKTQAQSQAQEVQEPPGERDSDDAGSRPASSDEVDWRTLFRGAAAQETFRKVRLCIVQKDDTLDAIAGRYQRNPREIALANRLDGSSLTEGQVLYIP